VGKQTQKDQQRGKSTYPQLLGDEKSREQSRRLVEQALAQLAGFGPSADPLRNLVQNLIDRKS
jgi:geranylgeranyl pyrophosphate synthase